MKIQEVTIEGYQSHTNSTFRLSPGLTVITGPSDAGKTAIIRALRWFAFNEPTGEAFLHTIRNPDGSIKEAVDQVKVSVTFDNGITVTKTRRKGKTTYTHSAFPTAWEKAEIPPEIKETLGLVKQQYGDFETCLNFAFQLDAPFMLSESASVGAKVLGKLAGTEIVDKSIDLLGNLEESNGTEEPDEHISGHGFLSLFCYGFLHLGFCQLCRKDRHGAEQNQAGNQYQGSEDWFFVFHGLLLSSE